LPLFIKPAKPAQEFSMGMLVHGGNRAAVLVHTVFFPLKMPRGIKLEKIQHLAGYCPIHPIGTPQGLGELIKLFDDLSVLVIKIR
jgi:hypothetical protein